MTGFTMECESRQLAYDTGVNINLAGCKRVVFFS